MANKEWWETFADLDCIYLWSWNDMTEYIQHSACTDFIIHSECTDTGQAFRFTQNGTLSILRGGADAGDDLGIYANDTDLCAAIKLYGDGNIVNEIEETSEFKVSTCSAEELLVVSATELSYKGTNICLAPCAGVAGSCPTKGDLPFILYDNCEAETGIGFQFTIAGTVSALEGGSDTGDDFVLKANSVDAYPFIKLFGNNTLGLSVGAGEEIIFFDAANQMFYFDRDGVISRMHGGSTTGDDLRILANSTDNCPMIELWGNAGIVNKIKAASGFEISTCSDETLWEVDNTNPTDKHVDFHCLDAHNFCLEIRTSNPSGPTCLGQIWFRSDLV